MGGWPHTGLVPVLQPPEGSSSPGAGLCERSSRAPSTAPIPSSSRNSSAGQHLLQLQLSRGTQDSTLLPKLIANRAGGSSAHLCTQANKRNTGKDDPTFLAGLRTAVQQQSGFLVEIPRRISATALQEHSSSHHALSCQQTGAKPLLGPRQQPTPHTGFV